MGDIAPSPQELRGDVDLRIEETLSLMLDPSLLLSMRTLPVITELARRNELQGAVIPRTFFEYVSEQGLNEDVLRFFGGPTGEGEIGRVGDILTQIRALRDYLSPQGLAAEAAERGISVNIQRQVRSEQVAAILGEEWAFLTSHSWMASRLKRPFSIFVKAGAFAIEGSRKSFDVLVAKTLKRPTGLSSSDRLRAVSKWVAVGGMSALPLIVVPPMQVLLGGAFGYFLLFDP